MCTAAIETLNLSPLHCIEIKKKKQTWIDLDVLCVDDVPLLISELWAFQMFNQFNAEKLKLKTEGGNENEWRKKANASEFSFICWKVVNSRQNRKCDE